MTAYRPVKHCQLDTDVLRLDIKTVSSGSGKNRVRSVEEMREEKTL